MPASGKHLHPAAGGGEIRGLMKPTVFVDGHEGTTGLQIHDRLASRDDVDLITIDPDARKDPAARAACLNAADIAFLCLPDTAARESVSLVSNLRTCVIDASTAHRVDPSWAYGLPELGSEYRERIHSLSRIAVGGCHATGFLLAVRPLLRHRFLPAEWPVSAFSITGYSGGGKSMINAYENDPPPALASPRPYALAMTHKHLPEMQIHSGLVTPPLFNPVVAAFYQGLAVTIPLPLAQLPGRPTLAAVHELLSKTYAGEPCVRVLPYDDADSHDAGFFDIQACNGTNRCDLVVFGNDVQAIVIARLDNLGKGASGAALQCMNLHLGLPETTGLPLTAA